eukprot:scaffold87690_cov30-Phaeocystis_antarctica.AAC.1
MMLTWRSISLPACSTVMSIPCEWPNVSVSAPRRSAISLGTSVHTRSDSLSRLAYRPPGLLSPLPLVTGAGGTSLAAAAVAAAVAVAAAAVAAAAVAAAVAALAAA